MSSYYSLGAGYAGLIGKPLDLTTYHFQPLNDTTKFLCDNANSKHFKFVLRLKKLFGLGLL